MGDKKIYTQEGGTKLYTGSSGNNDVGVEKEEDVSAQVYIIHDVPVFCPRWIFQVPINTPKFGTWNSQNLVENLKFEPRPP